MNNIATSSRAFSYRAMSMIGIALLLASSLLPQWFFAGDGDKKFLLAIAHQLLAGKKLYHDIFQPSFPLITWLYAIPVYFSSFIPLTAGHLLYLLTLAIVTLSALLCCKLMTFHRAITENARLTFWHKIVVLLILVFFVHPQFFADREHLIFVLMLPFLLSSMPSLARQPIPARLRLICAIMAALGVCIKPHALVILAGIYLLRFLRDRSLKLFIDAEAIAIAAVFAIYLLLMWLFTAEYFSTVLPMLTATYASNNRGLMVVQYYVAPIFTLGVTLADFRLRYTSPLRKDILYFLGLCVFCLGYVLINNGWIYTFYPLNAVILLLTFWVLWEFRWLKKNASENGQDPKQFSFGATACQLNLAVNIFITLLANVGWVYAGLAVTPAPRALVYDEMDHLMRDNHVRHFGVMSITYAYWPEAVEKTGAQMETRFASLYMLPKFLTSDAAFAQKNEWIIAYVAKAYAEDLSTNKPEIMFVDASNDFSGTGKHVDLIQYFSVYPAFAEAWKQYRLLKTIDHCDDTQFKDVMNREVWCRQYVYRRIE